MTRYFKSPGAIANAAVACATLLLVVACAPSLAAQQPPKGRAAPSKAQIRAELKNLVGNVSRRYPQYRKYATVVNKYLGLALNSKYDLSALKDATLLIPPNTEADRLAKRIPSGTRGIPTLYNISAYHIIRHRYALATLRRLPAGKALGTQLRQPLFKMTAKGSAAVAFGQWKAAASTWSTVRAPSMYVGPYFIAHGVDRAQVPAHTRV